MEQLLNEGTIPVGLIGCGRISSKHIEAIAQHPQLKLVALCDVDSSALERTKALIKHPVETYSHIDAFLTHSSLAIVVVCTPSGLHAEQSIAAALAGKHVVTEKPMAIQWRDGLRMIQACEEHDVKLFVVKQNRLNPTLQKLKHAIDTNRFGKIYHVSINVYWTRPQAYYDQASWRGTWSMDGGAFMNQASHYVDLLHWLLGPVRSLHAMTATLARNIEAEDTGVVNFCWTNGILGSMNVCMLTFPKNLEGSITILGEKGTVKLGGVAVNQITHWQFDSMTTDDEQVMTANYQTESVYGFGHLGYYCNVVDALQGKATAVSDGCSGLETLRLLNAIYESAHDGHVVELANEIQPLMITAS